MKYTTLLMDADDTIFDFAACEYQALRQTLMSHGLSFDDRIYHTFSSINSALWKKLELHLITRTEMRFKRFLELAEQCFAAYEHPEALGESYIEKLSGQVCLIDGARAALQRLSQVYDIFIITNGFKQVQRGRFDKAGLQEYYRGLYISDEIGVQKPDKAFFDYVLADIPEKNISRILVVGDSLTSDMQGGRNAGLDTCLYDPSGKVALPHPLCSYRIEALEELLHFD